jgi:hypothetical protein
MAKFVIYKRRSVSSDSGSVTVSLAGSVMAVSVGKSTVDVNVWWGIDELQTLNAISA